MRSVFSKVVVLYCAASVCGAISCHRSAPERPVATAADIQRLGTRDYPGRSREDVVDAVVTTLRLQGYEIVTTDPLVRTSPRRVATTTVGAGSGSYAAGSYRDTYGAQSFTEEVAWDISVEPIANGARLHATPRASVNGQPMDQFFRDWAERNFTALLREIDNTLATKSR